jgi:hypothetical protein
MRAAALDFTAATPQLDPCAKLSKLAPFMHTRMRLSQENGQFKTRAPSKGPSNTQISHTYTQTSISKFLKAKIRKLA